MFTSRVFENYASFSTILTPPTIVNLCGHICQYLQHGMWAFWLLILVLQASFLSSFPIIIILTENKVILVKTTPLQMPIWALVLAMAIATVGARELMSKQ